MLPKFEQFSRERQYLTNVSPATLEWYKHSFKWPPTESPIEDDLKAAVLRMREKGLKATSCNSAIRAINAYLHWSTAGADVKCSPACRHLRIPQLKEPQLILPTFSTAQVTRLVNWRPKAKVFWQRRLHLRQFYGAEASRPKQPSRTAALATIIAAAIPSAIPNAKRTPIQFPCTPPSSANQSKTLIATATINHRHATVRDTRDNNPSAAPK